MKKRMINQKIIIASKFLSVGKFFGVKARPQIVNSPVIPSLKNMFAVYVQTIEYPKTKKHPTIAIGAATTNAFDLCT